jgi:hypothetical protein
MLPSGLISVGNRDGRVSEVGGGLYVVEDAYKGDYDFFAPSQLYSTPKQTATDCQSIASDDQVEKSR